MKLSVALAAYNGEAYIVELLRSILAQTLPVDEVVITDDCSTDRTVEVVRDFLSAHPLKNWRIEVNETNLGYAENFRKAMDGCSGDLIFLCDQDDIWTKERTQVMVRVLDAHPEIRLLSTVYRPFRTGEPLPTVEDTYPPSAEPQKITLCRKTFYLRYPGCVMCVRRDFYESIVPYRFTGWAHDTFLWGMALLHDGCYALPYVSLLRRIHEKQTSGHVGHDKKNRIRYLEGVLSESRALLRAAEAADAPAKTKRLYRRMARTHRYRLELVQNGKWYRALQLLPRLPFYANARSYAVELRLAGQRDRPEAAAK